ncbi:glycoside hydrolase family 88 protein [bacterium]|nr:glycoside hydrolase family 88 protein [bacterium]
MGFSKCNRQLNGYSVLMMLSFLALAGQAGEAVSVSPESVGRQLTENLLSREHMFYGEFGLHYAEACAAVGALRIAVDTGDQAMQMRIIDRYQKLFDPGSGLVSRRLHVDNQVVGIVPLQIYLINRDKQYLDLGLSFADSQWENPREDGLTQQTRWWIDDMYMVCMLQMQAFRATGDARYADRGARQMAAYLDTLQQENGLFYHGPDSPFFWGRGNGWVASAMAEVLEALPENHGLRNEILGHYRQMMNALLTYQSDNGMWRQLVDYPYAWAESSCTAMFAYAMAVGIRRGWLDSNSYQPAVIRAWNALAAHIDRNGNVREICVGTGKVDDMEFYLKRPRHEGDFHGQAPVLWLAAEMMKGKRVEE